MPALLLALTLAGPARAQTAPAASPELIPAASWAALLAALELAEPQVGYTADQMVLYGSDAGILPGVRDLFRGPRPALRAMDKLSDDLVAAQALPDEQLRLLFRLLGAQGGRRAPIPGLDPDGGSGEAPPAQRGVTAGQPPVWGLPGLEDGLAPDRALERLLISDRMSRTARVRDCKARERGLDAFRTLPEPVQRLVVRLLVASIRTEPWLRAAVEDLPGAGAGASGPPEAGAGAAERLRLLSALRAEGDWPGQTATLQREALLALDRVDLGYLSFGAVLWTKQLRLALEEFDAAGGPALLAELPSESFGRIELATPVGPLWITDASGGAYHAAEAPALVVDLGGDDRWTGRFAVSTPHPVSVLVELGGSDHYEPGEVGAGSLALGLGGLGLLLDRGGDDVYEAVSSSLAAAWFGAGVLIDEGGDDRYLLAGKDGSAAAHAGVALLVDHQGDDEHRAQARAQGMGGPKGAALLMDRAGDDRYTIPDEAEPSALYLGRTVAMAQGCGYGRRADLGDGHSLAGGYGLLLDLAGDDQYQAMAWSQGAAYWWGVGLLDDRAGNDRYRNGKYSLGAGAHFGVGVQLDRAGDDRYNVEPERFVNPFTGQEAPVAENQFQGHGRDGSLGLSLDLGGDDHYRLRSHSGGSGDLGSVGLFYDRAGRDRYVFDPPSDPAGLVPALGSTTHYPEPFRSFRDELFTVGIFLDGGGEDVYEGLPEGRGEGQRWTERRSERERAVGIDLPGP